MDYLLGDIVGVRVSDGDDVPLTDRVREVRLTVDSTGRELVSPTVASDGANLSGLNLISTLRRMRRSLTRLETR